MRIDPVVFKVMLGGLAFVFFCGGAAPLAVCVGLVFLLVAFNP